MQRDAASLVRTPATPSSYANQLHAFEDPNLTGPDVQPHALPTPKQHAALSELLIFDDEKIFAWLTILRSIEPGFRYRAGRGCLSGQQLDALSILKDCDDSDILAWLTLSLPTSDANGQRTAKNTFSTPRSSVVSTPRHRPGSSTNSSLRSSNGSFAASAIFSNNSSYGTPRSSLGSLPELPEEILRNDESDHAHWCTYGEHSKPITTCEGWKRHEKEHESGYFCMPNGPVEHTQDGPICVLCRKAHPDVDHLARHNISTCVGKPNLPLKKSRRSDMITHLKQHRVHSTFGAVLADQWRYNLNKKCFSCGFCVVICYSITERSNHIDNEHWRYNQNMGAWKLSNSIKGLLLEPGVQAAWRVLLRSYPDLVESTLWWEMPSAEGLQLRLEMGDESGLALAKAALELSNYGRMRSNQNALVAAAGRDEMRFGLSSPAQSSAAAMVTPLSNSTSQPQPIHPQPRAQSSGLPAGPNPSNEVETSRKGSRNPHCDPSLSPLTFFNDSFQAADFRTDTVPHTGPFMDPNIRDITSQLCTYSCPTEWPSMDTSQPLDDTSRIQGHLSECGALLIAQLSSPRHAQPVTYANLDGQAPVSDSRNDINTSIARLLPTSTFAHSAAQIPNHEYGFNFRNKPLPPKPRPGHHPHLPGDESRAAEHRPSTPMDIGTG